MIGRGCVEALIKVSNKYGLDFFQVLMGFLSQAVASFNLKSYRFWASRRAWYIMLKLGSKMDDYLIIVGCFNGGILEKMHK